MKNRKIAAVGMAVVLCLSMLTGCDFLPPKTAVELVQRSSKVMADLDNYRMSMEINIDAVVTGDIEGIEMDMTLPIGLSIEMNRAGNYIAGEMEMDADLNATVSFMGQSETMSESLDESAELYMVIDDGVTYLNDGNTGWVRSEDGDEDAFDMQSLLDTDAENSIFTDATMEKTDTAYIVTLKFADALENEDFADFMSESMSDDMIGEADIDWDNFADAIGDADIIYTFDAKTYRMLSVETDGILIDNIGFISGMAGMDFSEMNVDSIEMGMDISIEFEKYGEIEEADVKVPDDVVENAIGEDDRELDGGLVFDDEVTDDEIDVTVDDAVDETIGDGTGEDDGVVNVEDIRFIYGNAELSIPTDYQTFLNDGWYVVDDGEYGSFLCMMNDKYGYTTLYLYTNDGTGTEASVKANGSDGFSMTIDEAGKYPALSLCGVTFGDDLDEVENILGEPDSTQAYSDDYGTYEIYEWEVEYDGIDCILTVSLWDGAVSEMSISHWG